MSFQEIRSQPLGEVEGAPEYLNERADDFSNICFDYEDQDKIPIKEEIKQEVKPEPLDEDNIDVETHPCEDDQEKRYLQAMVDKLLIEKQNLQVENQILKSKKTNEERQLEKEVRKLQVENQNLKEQLELSVLNSHKNDDKHLVEAAKKFKKSDFAQNLDLPGVEEITEDISGDGIPRRNKKAKVQSEIADDNKHVKARGSGSGFVFYLDSSGVDENDDMDDYEIESSLKDSNVSSAIVSKSIKRNTSTSNLDTVHDAERLQKDLTEKYISGQISFEDYIQQLDSDEEDEDEVCFHPN